MTEMSVAFLGLPGGPEWIVIAVVALLIFGRRLPDVARSVGKSIVEFKKGLRDMKEDVNTPAEDGKRILPEGDVQRSGAETSKLPGE